MKKKTALRGKFGTKTNPFQRLMLVLFGLSLLMLLELVLRITLPSARTGEDPFIGFSGLERLYVADSTGAVMRTDVGKLRWFNPQEFPRRKDPSTYRIFTLGGSTTYGHPFSDSTSFSGWARILLNDPRYGGGHRYEVINAGGISYASYRVVVLLEEVLDYDPDLVVIFTGHNEFLEARTYGGMLEQSRLVFRLREGLSHLRIYSLLDDTWQAVRGKGAAVSEGPKAGYAGAGRNILSPEVRTMLDQSAGLEYYRRDSLFSNGVFEHFRYNVARMISLCRERGVAVVFLDPVDNMTAFSPFKSQHRAGLSSRDWEKFNSLLAAARSGLERGQPDSAAVWLGQALELDALYAEAHYLLGETELARGDSTAAGKRFHTARELDVCPLRAPDTIHRVLREETARAGVELIDIPGAFERLSPGGLLGRAMIVDHIHPSPEGNLLIALKLLEWMKSSGNAADLEPPEFGSSEVKALYGEWMASLPPKYFRHGLVNLAKVLIWANKFREARAVLEENRTALEGEAEAQYFLGSSLNELGERENAVLYLQRSLALEPDHPLALSKLARVWADLGRADSAVADYEKYLRLFPTDPSMLASYGVLLGQLGRPDQGLAYLNRAARYDPTLPSLKNDYGFVYTLMREFGRARQAFLESLERDPGNPETYYNLGLVSVYQGNMPEAGRCFSRALELNPGYYTARINLGNVYETTGHTGEAEEQFRLALALNPDNPAAYLSLAHLYQAGGRVEDASRTAREGLARNPDHPQLKSLAGSN